MSKPLSSYATLAIDIVYECQNCGNVALTTDYECPCGTNMGWRSREPHTSDKFWLKDQVDWEIKHYESATKISEKLKEE